MTEVLEKPIFETLISHVYDVVFFRDASSRHLGDDNASVISHNIDVNLIDHNQKLSLVHKPGVLVFSLKHSAQLIPRAITETEKARPAMDAISIEMKLKDSQGKYNPRIVKLTLGDINTPKIIWLYPGLQYSYGHQQALYGKISFANDTAASWALLELQVEYKPLKKISLYAQADQNGEFDMPLAALPLRAKNISHYPALLIIKSQSEEQAKSQNMTDPDSFTNRKVGLNKANDVVTYADSLSLELKPELRTRVVTNGAEQLIINHLNN